MLLPFIGIGEEAMYLVERDDSERERRIERAWLGFRNFENGITAWLTRRLV